MATRLCTKEEEDLSMELEQKVWSPFNWKARGSVGMDYDRELHFVYEDNNNLLATIDGCGFEWDGSVENLPEFGWSEIVLKASQGFETRPRYASALGASVLPEVRGSGVAEDLLKALKKEALSLGYEGLVAPLRPAFRHYMPYATLKEYSETRLEDGRHYDPWVRIHEKIGGKIIGTCEKSAQFLGKRKDWEEWCSVKLPSNGRVSIPGSVSYLSLKDDFGYLTEPSIWILHEKN